MKKNNLMAIAFMIAGIMLPKAQVGIGISAPDMSSNLHVAPTNSSNQYKGTLLGTMTTSNRNSISQPATGLMIYNTTDNCLQINNGTPATPSWKCLSEEINLPFGNMNFARYKPMYSGITSNWLPGTPPSYSPTNSLLYGFYTTNGSFAFNELFRIDAGRMDSGSYTIILYNVSGESVNVSYNTVANGNMVVRTNIGLSNLQGSYVDGNSTTNYTEAQNIYVTINSPAKWAGRRFLIGINLFKEDVSNPINWYGDGAGKENQSMVTFISELK
ncbi:hypothetical protein [Chryseobacterium kwangjuense]|nr:hypothetical protein [Chryseobacterium kwangjuense]